MRFLYVTDLHGDEAKYKKVLEEAELHNYSLIVNGGDMFPKYGSGSLKTQQNKFILNFLQGYFEALQQKGIQYLAMPGNDDMEENDGWFDAICDEFDNVHNIANSLVTIDGYDFIGMNNILDHPFGYKGRVVMEEPYLKQEQFNPFAILPDGQIVEDWFSYAETILPKMKDILNNLPKPKDPQKAIYVMHMPPAGLHLGQLVSQDLDIGSVEITAFLEREAPLMSLHGHIHESPDMPNGVWFNRLGKTICVQPGQTEYGADQMISVEGDLEIGIGEGMYSRTFLNIAH